MVRESSATRVLSIQSAKIPDFWDKNMMNGNLPVGIFQKQNVRWMERLYFVFPSIYYIQEARVQQARVQYFKRREKSQKSNVSQAQSINRNRCRKSIADYYWLISAINFNRTHRTEEF